MITYGDKSLIGNWLAATTGTSFMPCWIVPADRLNGPPGGPGGSGSDFAFIAV